LAHEIGDLERGNTSAVLLWFMYAPCCSEHPSPPRPPPTKRYIDR
jgi:hypothetical protein